MRQVTGTINAWLPSYSRPDDLAGPNDEAFKNLVFSSGNMADCGWAIAGKATVTVELIEHGELVKNEVDALRAEQTKARSNAHLADVNFERKIQELLAITN